MRRYEEIPPPPPDPTELTELGAFESSWSVQSLAGDTVYLSDFSGRVVFLNLWATWCDPCRKELPGLQRLYDTLLTSGVVFLFVSNEPVDTVRRFLHERGYSVPVYIRSVGNLPSVLGSGGIPRTYIINRRGSIVFKHIGAAKWDDAAVIRFLRTL